MRRLLIAGPGRSGTTALVQILATAGMSTTVEQGSYFSQARAGFEAELCADSPEVVKSPHLTFTLPEMLNGAEVDAADISGVLLPIRDLDQVAGSRTANALELGSPRGPGALFGTTIPTRQAEVLALGLIDLVLALEEHGVAYRFLLYPRFTSDFDYLWSRLCPFVGAPMRAAIQAAWLQCIDPDLARISYVPPSRQDDDRLAASHAARDA